MTIKFTGKTSSDRWTEAKKVFLSTLKAWANTYCQVADAHTLACGQRSNHGLIYSAQLRDPEDYGVGIPLFWSDKRREALLNSMKKEEQHWNYPLSEVASAVSAMVQIAPDTFFESYEVMVAQK